MKKTIISAQSYRGIDIIKVSCEIEKKDNVIGMKRAESKIGYTKIRYYIGSSIETKSYFNTISEAVNKIDFDTTKKGKSNKLDSNTYCSNPKCPACCECSLVNYNRDCHNNSILLAV
ncbi:MAG: hypothetical protein M1391_14610 [Bacteroidetes bacterium]|nr:hypothetical protein [Bacteroidota bacterium]MCL6099795.1 hypothetical protein [Bacteroidota bacterium]